MKWVTWQQAVVAGLLSGLALLLLRRQRPTRANVIAIAAAQELMFISGIYALWRVARMLPLAKNETALVYARSIADLQDWLGMPSELAIQQFVIRHDWLARFSALYYQLIHVPALLVFLVWLFLAHRELYPRWRTGLAILTAFCLVIRFVRVAPPRFLEELGFVDLSTRLGLSSYGQVGTGVSDQFAAMPSIHVGWAAVVALGVFAASASSWRWLIVLHLPITLFVVAATGHHWWLDGVAALALLGIAMRIDTVVRRRWPRSPASVGGVTTAPDSSFEQAAISATAKQRGLAAD